MGEFFNLTVDFELSRVSDRPGRVHGPAGVDAGVSGSDVIDSQGHVTKVQGCLQS